MATLGSNVPTLLDLNSVTDPNGKIATPIEMLAQSNEFIGDIYVEEGNLPTGHRTTVWTSLPTISSRQLNEGVTPGKGTTDQFTDSAAILENYLVIDSELLRLAPDPTAYRMMQRRMFMEAFAQKVTSLAFSGNAITTPSDFTGLGPRYNDLDGSTGGAIFDAGGSGSDNASMWFIGHGPTGIAFVFPRGGRAGLQVEDKGEMPWQTSVTFGGTTSALMAYVEWYSWTIGLSVRDWRCAVRIANIDVSEAMTLSGDQELTDYGTFLLNGMIQAYYKVPTASRSQLRYAYYCNRTVAYALHIMALNKASSQLTIETVAGKPVTMFLGYPIRTVDQLGIAETAVSTSTVSI